MDDQEEVVPSPAAAGEAERVPICLPCSSPRDVLLQQQARELEYLRSEIAAKDSIISSMRTAAVVDSEPSVSSSRESSKTPSDSSSSKTSKTTSNGLMAKSVESLPVAPSPTVSDSPLRTKNSTPLRGPRVRVAKSMELRKSIPLTYYVCKVHFHASL
jgi:hypothetical protein